MAFFVFCPSFGLMWGLGFQVLYHLGFRVRFIRGHKGHFHGCPDLSLFTVLAAPGAPGGVRFIVIYGAGGPWGPGRRHLKNQILKGVLEHLEN